MTFKLENEYGPGNVTVDPINYPQLDAFKNVTAPGAGDGTPFEEKWINDKQGFFGALLSNGGVVPSGVPDTAVASDFYDAMLNCIENEFAVGFVIGAPITRYTNNSFSVAAQDAAPSAISFKPDGLKMYVMGNANNVVYEYNLGTAWNVSTAVYSGNSFSVAAQDLGTVGMFFRSDGLKMYMMGAVNDRVYEYNLGTAWNITTTVYSGNSFSTVAQDSTPTDVFFRSDGLKMYMTGLINNSVYEYNLGTAWDITTTAYSGNSFSVLAQDSTPQDVFFRSDGLKMIIVGTQNNSVYEYNLGTAWNVSTAVYSGNSFSVAAQDTGGTGIFFRPGGLKMYMTGAVNDRVYEYGTNFLAAR